MHKPIKKKIETTHQYTRPGFGVTVRTVVDTSGKVHEADSEDASLMKEIADDISKTIKKAKGLKKAAK